MHDPAVAATIGEQWDVASGRVGPTAAPGREPVPGIGRGADPRLGLLAGLARRSTAGTASPLRRAVKRLDDACLVERLEADQVRLHPLIREFAARQTSANEIETFISHCLERAAASLEVFRRLSGFTDRGALTGSSRT